MKQISLFALAGAIGYLVDTFALLLVYPWTGAYVGRFISFACAVLTTWLINRSLTFRNQRDGKSVYREFSLYFLSMIGGGTVNILCYFLVVYLFEPPPGGLPIAVGVGSLAGMLVNFTLSKRIVFTGRSEKGTFR